MYMYTVSVRNRLEVLSDSWCNYVEWTFRCKSGSSQSWLWSKSVLTRTMWMVTKKGLLGVNLQLSRWWSG